MSIGEQIAKIESPRFEDGTVDTIIKDMIELAESLEKRFKSRSEKQLIAKKLQPWYLERINLAMRVLLLAENGSPLYVNYPEISKTVIPSYTKIRNMIYATHGLRETEG